MELRNLINAIYEGIIRLMPLFRRVWIGTVALGTAMLIIALFLKKNPERKKSPWIVGGMGLLMLISSGTQLIASLF